jgi:hypothetical protein
LEAHRGVRPGMAGYQAAIRHRVTTISPYGCTPIRSEHSVKDIAQTTICGRARHLADNNPRPHSWASAKLARSPFGANCQEKPAKKK